MMGPAALILAVHCFASGDVPASRRLEWILAETLSDPVCVDVAPLCPAPIPLGPGSFPSVEDAELDICSDLPPVISLRSGEPLALSLSLRTPLLSLNGSTSTDHSWLLYTCAFLSFACLLAFLALAGVLRRRWRRMGVRPEENRAGRFTLAVLYFLAAIASFAGLIAAAATMRQESRGALIFMGSGAVAYYLRESRRGVIRVGSERPAMKHGRFLYLRRFHRDEQVLGDGVGLLTWYSSLEEEIVATLGSSGDVVALGDSERDVLPPLGAHRLYVTYERWQSEVRELASTARLVVIVADPSDAIAWEIRMVLDLGRPRLLLIVPPDQRESTWIWLRNNFSELASIHDEPAVVGFTAGGVPMKGYAGRYCPRGTGGASNVAAALRAVLHSLGFEASCPTSLLAVKQTVREGGADFSVLSAQPLRSRFLASTNTWLHEVGIEERILGASQAAFLVTVVGAFLFVILPVTALAESGTVFLALLGVLIVSCGSLLHFKTQILYRPVRSIHTTELDRARILITDDGVVVLVPDRRDQDAVRGELLAEAVMTSQHPWMFPEELLRRLEGTVGERLRALPRATMAIRYIDIFSDTRAWHYIKVLSLGGFGGYLAAALAWAIEGPISSGVMVVITAALMYRWLAAFSLKRMRVAAALNDPP